MTAYMPEYTGIEDVIIANLVSLLIEALQTEIDPDDVSYASVIQAGPLQDDPEAVNVMVHENDPLSPAGWAHFPVPYTDIGQTGRPGHLSRNPQIPIGYEMVGGGARMGYCFTIEIAVFGDETTLSLAAGDVRQLAALVSARAWQALKEAGSTIGTGQLVQDDYGSYVILGPFRGEFWTEQQEGEAQIARRYLRFFYQVMEP